MVVLPTPDISVADPHNTNSMAHWLHCNRCLCYPEANLKFYLTNCSHIYCEQCVQACTKEKCHVCGSECKTLLLNNKINKDIEGLFIDSTEVIKRCMKKIEQNLDFQKNHQKRLMRQLRVKVKELKSQVTSYQGVIKQARAMEREFIRMKSENEYLKLLLSKKDSHTRCRSGISPGNYNASSGTMPCDINQHHAHNTALQHQLNKAEHLSTGLHWGTPLKGSIHSNNCTPNEFKNQGYPMSIPRPIVFPKSG